MGQGFVTAAAVTAAVAAAAAAVWWRARADAAATGEQLLAAVARSREGELARSLERSAVRARQYLGWYEAEHAEKVDAWEQLAAARAELCDLRRELNATRRVINAMRRVEQAWAGQAN